MEKTEVFRGFPVIPSFLAVSEEPKSSWKEVLETVQEWKAAAQLKITKSVLERVDSTVFVDAENIIQIIQSGIRHRLASRVTEEYPDEKWDALFVCRDEYFNIQGLAIFNSEETTLKGMVIDPDNILHPIHDKEETTRGVGSAIIFHLAKIAAIQEKTLKLEAYRSAVSFYKKLGFEQAVYANSDMPEMFLTAEKVKRWITL